MAAKKTMTYSRFFLVLFLVIYLILVWMYFKDHVLQLTSSSLLLWFVIIPTLLLCSIIAIRWWQKKLENQASEQPRVADEKESIDPPNSHKLFIHSSICMPEGIHWSEVIDNDEDLTLLSDTLSDFDGLPILIKPITKLADPETLPYQYLQDKDLINSEIDPLTLRLCSLIHEQLFLSEEILSDLAKYFNNNYQQEANKPNSAVHIHPDWQQHYLVSADEKDTDDAPFDILKASIAKLSIYLALPASADAALLSTAVEEQMVTYGIPKALLFITPIITDEAESIDVENSTTSYNPTQFIDDYLLSLSQAADPEICLLLVADSQINEERLASLLDAEGLSNTDSSINIVPTEASVLLIFYNQATQDVLNIDNSVGFLLTEVCDPKATANKSVEADANSLTTNRRSYLNNLTVIKNLLIDNSFSLDAVDKKNSKTTSQSTAEARNIADNDIKTNVSLTEINISVLSDINPLTQPYDMSVFLNFTDNFVNQDIILNTHHLGSYMPLNTWLKPLISLSLFVSLVYDGQQESELSFLITQHKHSCMLWTVESSQVS